MWKVNFFPGQGKSGSFVDGQGNIERTWKIRGKLRNLKINGYGRLTLENLFILFKKGKMYFLMRKSKPISILTGSYSEDMENWKSQGKITQKSKGNFEVDDKWQP